MPDVNEKLENAFLARDLYLSRYKLSVVRRVQRLLAEMEVDVTGQLLRAYKENLSTSRLERLLAEIRKISAKTYKRIQAELKDELGEFAASEGAFTGETFNKALPATVRAAIAFGVPAEEVLVRAALSRPLSGKLLSEAVSGLEAADFDRLRTAIRVGFAEGEGIAKIVRRITGTRALRYKDGVNEVTRRQTEALIRTAVQNVAQSARMDVFNFNEPLIDFLRYTATLDGRTTQICRSRDGREYKLGEPMPMIPAHYQCRSVYRAITKSWDDLGLGKSEIPEAVRPFVRSTKAVRNIPKADRELLTGRVPASTTYGPWLKAQPAAFQDEVLGVRKGKLFRQGKLDIEAFSDPSSGHEYTLAELKVREPSAWKLAFGNE